MKRLRLSYRPYRAMAATPGIVVALALVLLASCSGAPKYRGEYGGDAQQSDVVTYAKSFLGTPYSYGGTTRRGIDCSGLVTTVYGEFDVRLPRTAYEQSLHGRDVSRRGVQPGDLVFFQITRSRPVSHVGIYIGDGQFIHASISARHVRIDRMDNDYFRRRFVKAKRVTQS